MSKKVFWAILIPALLLIGGYIALQIFLRSGNGSTPKQEEGLSATAETKAKGGIGTTGTTAKNKEAPAEEKEDSTSTKAVTVSTPDSLGGEEVSSLDLRPLFIQKMQQLVQKSTNGLYQLSVGDMELDVFSSEVSLLNVTLKPNSQIVQKLRASGKLPASVYTVSFKALTIEGINLDDAITSKTMDYKLVKLVNPVIEIDQQKIKKVENNNGDFSQQFLKEMEKLAVARLVVVNGEIRVKNKQKGSNQKFQQVGVQMNNILLNNQTRNDKSRFLFAKEAKMEFHHFSTATKDGLYHFKIKDAFINATGKEVVLKNLSFGSPLSKEAFMKRKEKAAELYGLLLPTVTVSGIDWWKAFNSEEISAGSVQTKGGKLTVYFDRSLPPKNKMGNFPSQLLAKAPMPINIDKLKLQDMDISYEEYNPLSGQSGTVYLDKTTMNITNLHNKTSGQPVEINGSALLMHTVPVKATFRFSMEKAKAGTFSATLNTGAFEATVINPIAKPLGMMKIDKGSVKKLQVSMHGNEKAATGNVTLLYEDLKLSLMEKNKEGDGLNEKNLLSFLANVLVIKNDNPWWLKKEVRKKEAYFERDPEAGFMNLVWKTAFVGVLKTLGAPEKLAKKKEAAQ